MDIQLWRRDSEISRYLFSLGIEEISRLAFAKAGFSLVL